MSNNSESTKQSINDIIPETSPIVNSAIYKSMDEDNKKGLLIMESKGVEAAVKYMFNPTGDRELSYSEMRARFG